MFRFNYLGLCRNILHVARSLIYKLEDAERLTQKVSLLLCDACTLYRLLLLETCVGTRSLYSVSIGQYGGTCACSCVEIYM